MAGPGGNDGRPGSGPDREPLGDRLRRMFLKPAPETPGGPDNGRPTSPDGLEARAGSLDDQERLLGVVAAPLAALIGILVGGNEIARASHSTVGTYDSLLAVLVALSVVMLVMTLLRKRLYLGMAMALYGLAVFNLHYWGFGIPFVLGGAWLLVRSYRIQRDLRESTEGPRGGGGSAGRGPRPSKRYTPPGARPRRPARPDDR